MEDTLFLRELKRNRFFDDLKYIFGRIGEEAKQRRLRVVLVLNPRSTQAKKAETEILRPLNQFLFEEKQVTGVTIFRYAVLPTDLDDNAKKLAEVIEDGDVVIAIGGDGTAAIGVNAVMLSGKRVAYYTLPYGNFNDIAKTVKMARGREVYALEALVDEAHFRFALCYFTLGMLAESTKLFDEPRVREYLKKKKRHLFYSLWVLAVWFLKNRRQRFLSRVKVMIWQAKEGSRCGDASRSDGLVNDGKIDSSEVGLSELLEVKKASDVIVLNGETMAKILKGGKYYQAGEFLLSIKNLRGVFSVGWFMLRGFLCRVAGKKVGGVTLEFSDELEAMEIQSEGEYKKISQVRKIEFKKATRPLQIL